MSPRFGTSRDWLEYSYLSVPGYRSLSEDHEFFVGASLSVLDVDTQAMFPNTAESFPEYFANPQLRLAYKERIKGNKIWGTSLTIGSPSDRPFASIHEVSLSTTAFLRLPVDQSDDAWILLLNFANDRSFLQYVPLPGIAYVHRPSEDFMAYLGVPFIYVKYNPAPRWTLRASYVIPRTVHANVMSVTSFPKSSPYMADSIGPLTPFSATIVATMTIDYSTMTKPFQPVSVGTSPTTCI
jgi:hypothetical protein